MILTKIAAISDVHIFNNKRFDEHRKVFELLDKDLKKKKPELILLLGDIIDSKNKLSPEQIVLVRDFFKMLSTHCRVAYIIGNHDRSLQTDNRLDSLSTIVDTIENAENEIVFLKNSQVYDLGYDNCQFAVWSWLENNKQPTKENNEKYTIGLYHGVIDGATTKDGHKLSGGIPLEKFNECDIVIAGDIHNKTEFRNGEISYVSSLLQVSVNEDAHGSYSTYEWNGKTFVMSRNIIHNEDAIETIHIDEHEKLTDIKVKNVRLKYDTDELNRKNVREIAKSLSKNHNIKVTTFPIIKKKKSFIIEKTETKENEIIDYYNDFINTNKERLGLDDLKIEYLNRINNEFKTEKELDFELGDYHIKSLKISNLLTYSINENILKFDKEGLIGILGKNRAGKSSVIKIIQFVLFGELPSNSLLYSFLNKNNRKEVGYGEVIFEKNGKLYKINRGVKPKTKRKADSTISFVEISESGEVINDLNKSTKTETEKEIRRYLGLNDYFEILSIFSAQKKQVEFIDCKNAERLSLLNKFLNLQEYEEKEVMVKEQIKEKSVRNNTLISQYETYFNIDVLKEGLETTKVSLEDKKAEYDKVNVEISSLNPLLEEYKINYYNNLELSKKDCDKRGLEQELYSIKEKINAKQENTKEIKIKQFGIEEEITSLEKLLEEKKQEVRTDKSGYIENYNLVGFELYKKSDESLKKDFWKNEQTIEKLNEQLENKTCSVCNNEISEERITKIKNEIVVLENDKREIQIKIDDITKINITSLKKFNDVTEAIETVRLLKNEIQLKKTTIKDYEYDISDNNVEVSRLENRVTIINQNIKELNDILKAKELVEKYKPLFEETNTKYGELKQHSNNLETDIKVLENKKEEINSNLTKSIGLKRTIDDNEEEISLLKIYRDIVSKKGLPLYVLNLNIEEINNKINAIISQVFDFELSFEINEEKGEATINFIYPDDIEPNEVTMASGSETFLINLCIKVGLSQISKLPKINTLFIDEGYDVLDYESISKLPNVFEILKNYYENIYTITHLDEVKMILDDKIELVKEKGYTVIS